MFLVYINPLNKNYKGEFIYEFIFSKKQEIEFGDDWMTEPASAGDINPPETEYIHAVGILQNEDVELELAMHSDNFPLSAAVENIIALGWEKESPDTEKRLVFQYGDTFEVVKDRLYSRDLELIMDKKLTK